MVLDEVDLLAAAREVADRERGRPLGGDRRRRRSRSRRGRGTPRPRRRHEVLADLLAQPRPRGGGCGRTGRSTKIAQRWPAQLELADQPEDRRVAAGADPPRRHDPGHRPRAASASPECGSVRDRAAAGRRGRRSPTSQSSASCTGFASGCVRLRQQRALGHGVRRERVAPLEREGAAQRPRHAVGAGADDRAGLADRVVAGGDGERRARSSRPSTPWRAQPALVVADQPADGHRRVHGMRDLDVVEHLAQRAELVEVAAQELRRRVVVRVQHARVGVEDLREARPRSSRAPAAGPRRRGPCGRGSARHAHLATQPLTSEKNVQRPGEARGRRRSRRAVRPSRCTSISRPPSPQVAKWRSISHLIMCEASGRGSCGPNTSATSSACSKPSSSAASQPSCAGVASWVMNATWSPSASSIARLRVPPCENSDFGIAVDARAVALGDLQRAVGRARVDDQQLDLAVDALGADGRRAPRRDTAPRCRPGRRP